MARTKIYEDKDLIIFTKRDVYIGEEADIGDTLIEVGLINMGKFASHLAEEGWKTFWPQMEAEIAKKIKDVQRLS